MPTALEEMRIVARRLQPLNVNFTFIGGAVLGLLVDDVRLSQVRATKDVDVVVAVVTYAEFAALEARLRAEGFKHDTSEGAPVWRWIVDGCLVDIMPRDTTAWGFSSKWFDEVLAFYQVTDLGDNISARVVSPAVFIATKLEAFKDRGCGDYMMSRDLGDIITLMDGRATIVEDITLALPTVRSFISDGFTFLLGQRDFQDYLPEHLPNLEGARQRLPLVRQRFEAVARLNS